MKNLLSILTLAAAVCAVSVQPVSAQTVEATPTGGAVIYNSVASNLPVSTVTIDCSGQKEVAVQWTLTLNGAGTDVHGIRFIPICEPGTRPSTPTLADGFSMAIAANGTTPVIVATNFTVKGWTRLDCYYMTNGTAALATNVVKYRVKKNAP